MSNPLNPDPNTLLTTVGGGRMTSFYSRPVVSIVVGLWTYLACLYAAAWAPRVLARAGLLEVVVLSLPLLALLLMVGITYFIYRASDEYIRQRMLKAAALTGVILAFSTATYFGLEQLGFARLSMLVVNVYGWAVFNVLLLWVLYRAR